MAHHYNLWLAHSGDKRELRDFLFDACRCTRFWTGPMTTQEGRPDSQERAHYSVNNEYNLIALCPKFDSRSYRNDVSVFFTLNAPDRWSEWEKDVIEASVRWMARTRGDALLDWDGLPIVGRTDEKGVVVNDFSKVVVTQRVLDARRPEYQSFLTSVLQREGLKYQVGPLDPI